MTQLGAWEVGLDDQPLRLVSDRSFLEKNFETWIEKDPSMLGGNVRWVARQLVLPDRSRLDLLGLTNDGTWVIVELKAGPVLTSTVLQVLHYFLQIETLPDAELVRRIRTCGVPDASVDEELEAMALASDGAARDYQLVVAGVGAAESASSAAEILARHGFTVPVRVVRFDLFATADGRRVLLREVDEEASVGKASRDAWTLDAVLKLADANGVGQAFREINDDLSARGFRTSVKKWGLNYNLGTRLQIFWIKPVKEKLQIGYLSSNFPGLFGIDEADAECRMGPNWVDLFPEEAVAQVRAWADLVQALATDAEGESAGDA